MNHLSFLFPVSPEKKGLELPSWSVALDLFLSKNYIFLPLRRARRRRGVLRCDVIGIHFPFFASFRLSGFRREGRKEGRWDGMGWEEGWTITGHK